MKIKNAYGVRVNKNGIDYTSLETKDCKLVKLFDNNKRKENQSKVFKDITKYIKESCIDDKYQLLHFFKNILKNEITKMKHRCIVDDKGNDKICYSYIVDKRTPFAIRGYDREIRKFIRAVLNESNYVVKDEYGNVIERSHLNIILRDSCMSQSDMYHYLLKGLKLSGNKHTRFPALYMTNWDGDPYYKYNGGTIDLRGVIGK